MSGRDRGRVDAAVSGSVLCGFGVLGLLQRHPGEGRDGNRLEAQPVDGQGAGATDRLPTTYHDPADVEDVRELAEAERAVARGAATRTQTDGVDDAARSRRGEDRLDGWRRHRHRP